MSPVLRPTDSGAGWGSLPAVDGNPATTIPDPVTGVSVTSTVQSNTATTKAISQRIVLPPPPGVVMNALDPSGALLMWAQNLIRKMGGYTATPVEDSLLMEDTSETVDWTSRQQIQELALFDIDRAPTPQQMTEADLWPDDSTKAWVKAQKYQAGLGFTPVNKAGDTGVGALTLTDALMITGNASAVAGSISKGAGGGFTVWAVTGSTYDYSLVSAAGSHAMNIPTGTINIKFQGAVGFNGTNPLAKPTITGSRGGNAALASLLTSLANYGLITDSTTA